MGQIETKVSQTDYDKKTGELSKKYTQVKQTADSQATDIVDIKKTATSQASKINSISSDVDGTKQSISDIKKTQNSQSDKVNQITNDVNGTKQSITDIQTKDEKQDTRMGTIETSVSGVKSDFSSYRTTNDGVVKNKRGINVPGIKLGFDYLSPKDISDLTFGAGQPFDYVAASFCRCLLYTSPSPRDCS